MGIELLKFESFDHFCKWRDSLKETPFGRIKIWRGARMSDDYCEAEFELEDGSAVFWDSKAGWQAESEHKERQRKIKIKFWNEGWEALSDVKRELILLIFPDIHSHDKSEIKPADQKK